MNMVYVITTNKKQCSITIIILLTFPPLTLLTIRTRGFTRFVVEIMP